MEMITLFTGVISLIALIVFFVMASNIAGMKQQVKMSNRLLHEISQKIKPDEVKMVDGKPVKKSIKPWECPKCKTLNKTNPSICEKCDTIRDIY